MPELERPRSALATVVGWALVVVIAWLVLRTLLGTVFWLVRTLMVVAVIVGLVWAYLALKAPRDGSSRR